jgi:hypothetical protein
MHVAQVASGFNCVMHVAQVASGFNHVMHVLFVWCMSRRLPVVLIV